MTQKLKPGDEFGKLTVVSFDNARKAWLCDCKCGGQTYARSWALKTDRHTACSCQKTAKRPKRQLPDNLALKRDMLANYKRSAARRGHSFKLSESAFFALIAQPCYWCGAAPVEDNNARYKDRGFAHNGVDRLDNTLGYSKRNCVACCSICNLAKRGLTQKQWRDWIARISRQQGLIAEHTCSS